MTDPYQILGISQNATDEQVKQAYNVMQRKYHPDNYDDSNMKKFASEKLQEATDAFDSIMNERRKTQAKNNSNPTITIDNPETGGNNSSYSYEQAQPGGYTNYNANSSAGFTDIRNMIQNNRMVEAEELLDGMGPESRTAEWYFLKGTVFFSRGWIDDATNYFSTANRMDPNNAEYRAALNRMAWQRQGNFGSAQNGQYRTPQNNVGGCSGCDLCSGLICADCCCECMGGDLISCC